MKSSVYEKLPKGDFPIAFKRFYDHREISFHFNEKIEILYFLSGSAVVYLNETEHHVKEGDIVFINSMETHRGVVSPGSIYYVFHLDVDFFSTFIDDKFVLIKNIISDPRCTDIIKNIIQTYEHQEFGYKIELKRDFYILLAYILKHYVKKELSAVNYSSYFKKQEHINNIVKYISTNYDQPITLESIAREFYISRSYLSHFFKRNMSKTVIEYINDLRIEKAKLLLLDKHSSVSETALAVGYNDANYFSRIFKIKTGFTPLQYKSELHK